MAGSSVITNPDGAFGQTDSWANQFRIISEHVASTAITKGDLVALVWSETTRKLKAAAYDTDDHGAYGGTGIAAESGAIGDVVQVVVFGFAMANIGSDTPAIYENLIGTSTAGVGAAVAAAETTVAGSILGYCLGDEDAALNLVPVWVSPR